MNALKFIYLVLVVKVIVLLRHISVILDSININVTELHTWTCGGVNKHSEEPVSPTSKQ